MPPAMYMESSAWIFTAAAPTRMSAIGLSGLCVLCAAQESPARNTRKHARENDLGKRRMLEFMMWGK